MSEKNKKGQVLLIAVMLLATVITVVMTIAFNTTTETQVARLETDSQKALAAAEAGIDAVIKSPVGSQSFNVGTLEQFSNQKISGTAQVVGDSKPYFVTPLLQQDEQYTFYLSAYPNFTPPWSGSFNIYLVSETGQCPSIEVTIIKQNYEQDRYAYNTCSLAPGIIINAPTADPLGSPKEIDAISFSYKTSTPISVTNGLVAFVKVLNARTKLGFENVDLPIKSFPIQGKTVESEARTQSGVVKKVQLFQSFPQIPSNFFMTSF